MQRTLSWARDAYRYGCNCNNVAHDSSHRIHINPSCFEQSLTPELTAGNTAGSGALQKCAARMQRLERLSQVLETFAENKWAESDPTELLLQKLKLNPYFEALRSQMTISHKIWLVTNKERLESGLTCADSPLSANSSHLCHDVPPSIIERSDSRSMKQDLNLSGKASKCSDEAAMELHKLRAIDSQAKITVQLTHFRFQPLPLFAFFAHPVQRPKASSQYSLNRVCLNFAHIPDSRHDDNNLKGDSRVPGGS
jgi:hypothetical protein